MTTRNIARCARLALALAAAVALVLPAAPAGAQGYPSRTIRMVVPYPAGGPNDIIGRIVAQKLTEALGQQTIVDNRGGAAGSIGTMVVVKSPADGYTLLSGGMGNLVMNPIIEKTPYDTLRDLVPVIMVATAPNVLVVHPSLPVKDVRALIALARAHPGELNYGSGGIGSTPHLSGALFNSMAKVNIVHVPYKGNAPAIADLIGGQVQLAFLGIPPVQPHVAAGKLRALAVTSAQRSKAMPQVPTIAESGVPGYELSPWYGVLAPAGTPAEIVTRLNTAIANFMRTPEMTEKLAALGAEPETNTPAEYTSRIRADTQKWTRVIREAGLKAE